MKRFILIVGDDVPVAQRDSFTKWLKEGPGTGVGFWHWFQQSWLLTDPLDRSFEYWQGAVTEQFGQKSWILQEVAAAGPYTGFAPTAATDWFKGNWFQV